MATDPENLPEGQTGIRVEIATVAVPHSDPHYTCPGCEEPISSADLHIYAKPARGEMALNDVLRHVNGPDRSHPICGLIFSPRDPESKVVRIIQQGEVIEAAEIGKLLESSRIVLPYPNKTYRCPACEQDIPTTKQIRLAKPANHAHELNDILRCPWCGIVFSPKNLIVTVLRG